MAISGVEDSPGFDMGDGPLDHREDPVGLLRLLAQFVVGGLLVRGDHPLPTYPFVGDLPGRVDSLQQSGGAWGGYIVHGPGLGVGNPREPADGQNQVGIHACHPMLVRP